MAEHLAASALRGKGRGVAASARAGQAGGLEGVLGARTLAYVLDSVVLAVFTIAFVAAGSLNLLLRTDGGFTDVSDSARWQFVYICLAAIPAWVLLTFLLLARRAQTIGQYIVGVTVTRQDGRDLTAVQLVLYLTALHPLVFHPILGLFWLLAAFVSISVFSSDIVFVLFGALAVLSAISPLVGLVAAAGDGGRRALHDRIAGTTVVRLE